MFQLFKNYTIISKYVSLLNILTIIILTSLPRARCRRTRCRRARARCRRTRARCRRTRARCRRTRSDFFLKMFETFQKYAELSLSLNISTERCDWSVMITCTTLSCDVKTHKPHYLRLITGSPVRFPSRTQVTAPHPAES